MTDKWAPVVNALKWIAKRARHLFWLAVGGFALFVLGRAARGDWGEGVKALSLLTFGGIAFGAFALIGFLLGVGIMDRIRRNQPVVGALPDVVKAVTVSAETVRGEIEQSPLPHVPSGFGEDDEESEAMADAAVRRALAEAQRLAKALEEGNET